jgi:hypothetical protein
MNILLRAFRAAAAARRERTKNFTKSGQMVNKRQRKKIVSTIGLLFVLIFCYSALLIVKNRRTTSLQVHYLSVPFLCHRACARLHLFLANSPVQKIKHHAPRVEQQNHLIRKLDQSDFFLKKKST